MLIRYRFWGNDGTLAHTVSIGLRQLTFLDSDKGLLDVRMKSDIEWLLRDELRRYEIAYAHYGVTFASDGTEVSDAPVEEEEGEVEEVEEEIAVPKRRGRPPKRR